MKTETILFVGISIGMSFLLDAICFAVVGPLQSAPEIWAVVLKIRMLIPAFTAMGLLLYYRASELNRRVKLFFTAYLCALVLPMVFELTGLNIAGRATQIAAGALLTAYIVSLHFRRSPREADRSAGLLFQGRHIRFIAMLLGYTLLLGISFWLNRVSGLSGTGTLTSFKGLLISFPVLLLHIVVYAWIIYFGEEYGWRYYLQERVCHLFGLRKGLVLVGLIWGIWHAPVIAMGYNYPSQPILGIFTMVCFCIVMGVLFGYSYHITGGIWAPVLLHGITNTMGPRFLAYFGQPHDSVFSFGLGFFGVVLFAVPAGLLLAVYIPRRYETAIGGNASNTVKM